jgi:hypothetical protein
VHPQPAIAGPHGALSIRSGGSPPTTFPESITRPRQPLRRVVVLVTGLVVVPVAGGTVVGVAGVVVVVFPTGMTVAPIGPAGAEVMGSLSGVSAPTRNCVIMSWSSCGRLWQWIM